jgi:hypothetical protein
MEQTISALTNLAELQMAAPSFLKSVLMIIGIDSLNKSDLPNTIGLPCIAPLEHQRSMTLIKQ